MKSNKTSFGEETAESTTGRKPTLSRRSILRKSVFASTVTAGLASVQNAASSHTVETLNGSNTESEGAYDEWLAKDGDCGRAELAIGSAIDEDSATYADDPAPLTCDWAAKSHDCEQIDNLTMTVSIENTDDWNISDTKKSKREAPAEEMYKPSFGVSVGYIAGFSLGFSSDGTDTGVQYDKNEVSYDFGTACNPCTGYGSVEENTGWLIVHLNDPGTGCENTNCKVSVDVTADTSTSGSCPGPCCSSFEGVLSAQETFEVEFDADDC